MKKDFTQRDAKFRLNTLGALRRYKRIAWTWYAIVIIACFIFIGLWAIIPAIIGIGMVQRSIEKEEMALYRREEWLKNDKA